MFLGAILIVTTTLLSIIIQNIALPFTQPREMQQKGSNFLKIMLGTLIMGALIGFVYLASFFPGWVVYILGALALLGNVFIYKYIRGIKFIIKSE
jgi:predicted lipid-binding transport protein (Tim44 family)